MKPKLLFVDDRTKRIHYAMDYYSKNYDVTIATCVPEALRQMVAASWDRISLDHDLNGHDFEDPETPTCGMEIVRYLEKCGGWYIASTPPMFWIHSSNLFAAHLMTVRLRKMGFVCIYMPILYGQEHMTYDEKGLPNK